MKFTCNEYIQSSVDEGIFYDITFPNIIVEHIGKDKFLEILKEYCDKECLVFNKDDKNLPPIFAPDWYQECLMQEEDDIIEVHHEMTEEENKFYNKLKDIPQDKLTYVFFEDE